MSDYHEGQMERLCDANEQVDPLEMAMHKIKRLREEIAGLKQERDELRRKVDGLVDKVGVIAEERDKLKRQLEWQPMETAPKDGRWIIFRYGKEPNRARFIRWDVDARWWEAYRGRYETGPLMLDEYTVDAGEWRSWDTAEGGE